MPLTKQQRIRKVLSAALALHDQGFPVVPCDGKKPIWKAWDKTPGTREKLSEALNNGRALNIGIVLNLTDLIDVEYDNGDEGEATLLELFGDEIPPTPSWESSRGIHRLFHRPEGLPRKAVVYIDGIEFRIGNGKGALSVVPPSEGRRWLPDLSLDEVEPAELPEHIVEQLKYVESKTPNVSGDDGGLIVEGRRNETLFALACAMRRHGVGDKNIELALRLENEIRCKPPLSEKEILNIARSAVAYDTGNSFNLFNLFEPPVLGPAALHGFAGECVRAIEPYTEAPVVGILAHLLAATGMMVGPDPYVYAGGNQPARVNIALVGHTSIGRKGTSFSVVDVLLRRLDVGPRLLWKAQCMRGLSTGEGLINAVADYKEFNKETGELEEVSVEKRLFAIEAEFAKVLVHVRRDGNILSHVLRDAFDCGHLQVLTRESPLRADGAHIVVVGHITPDELKKRLTELDMANGFANRFLWLYIQSEKELPDAPPLPNKLVKTLASKWSDILRTARKIKRVKRDKEANELWKRVYSALRIPKAGLRGAILARAETVVTRLSLIYALLDKSHTIQRVHLEAALALWQYSTESVQMLFADKTGDSVADRLYERLVSPMTKTELFTHIAEPAAVLNSALAELEAAGRIKKSTRKPSGRGRPADVWQRV